MTTIVANKTETPSSRGMRIVLQSFVAVGCATLLLWSYWQTIREMQQTWEREPDYSHGYLVLPAAIFFLWERRRTRPTTVSGPAWGGLILISAAAALRYIGGRYFMAALDGWSLSLAIAGCVWLLLGRYWLNWSWSSIAFLLFMVPLPWRVETYLSFPLQRVAATCSTWLLQFLGLPAVQQGNTILLENLQLEVEQACSGLRMTIAVTAISFGCLMLRPMEWWQRTLIIVGILPIALLANTLRIVATALMFRWVDGETAHRFAHDLAGWAVIPIAAVMLWAYDKYLQKLIIEYEPVVMSKPVN